MGRRGRSSSAREPTQRQLRAGELIRHALCDIFAREDFRDPDLTGIIITVGEVRTSPDLKHANIFVTPLGDESAEGREKLVAALTRASGFLRTRLGEDIDLRYTPQLHFIGDDSYNEGAAMERLLADPRIRRDIKGEE
jgi:ribosome-binding factor A